MSVVRDVPPPDSGGDPWTHLRVTEPAQVGVEVELDTQVGPGQSDAPDEQHHQHDVGEGGCEVHHL